MDPRFFAPSGEARGFGLQTLAADDRFGQRFARAAAAFFGAGLVDLVVPLGGVGQNQHLVARDLQEAAANGHRLLGAALLDAHDARQQRGQQRRMARQDTDHAIGARRDDHVHGFFGEDFAFGGHDLHS